MLGKQLKKLREEKNLTQSEVAKQLQLNRVTYNRYELGTREPDNTTLVKLANFFDVSIDYLLGKSNVRTPIQTVAAHMIDPSYEFTEEEEADIRDYIEYIKSKAKAQRDKRNK